MGTDKRFVAGDLVLVKFPGYGYWPAKIVAQKITADYKKGGRKIVCFGEHEKGFAYIADMKYYDESSKMKYISKTSLKKYPPLTKALEQISLEFRNVKSADSAKTMRLSREGKNVHGTSKKRIEEVTGPIDGVVDVSKEVPTNENVKESNLNSNDDDPIEEESFKSTREFHTIPCPDVCEIISQPTKADENRSQPIKRFKLASGSKANENKSEPTKRFKLSSKARFSLCDGNDKEDLEKTDNFDPPFQPDLFDYEIKVETDFNESSAENLENGDAGRMQVNEQSGSNNSQNEDPSPTICRNCFGDRIADDCVGDRIADDTVKIKMEIEMSSASFARVAHVLPPSLALKMREASKNPSIEDK